MILQRLGYYYFLKLYYFLNKWGKRRECSPQKKTGAAWLRHPKTLFCFENNKDATLLIPELLINSTVVIKQYWKESETQRPQILSHIFV